MENVLVGSLVSLDLLNPVPSDEERQKLIDMLSLLNCIPIFIEISVAGHYHGFCKQLVDQLDSIHAVWKLTVRKSIQAPDQTHVQEPHRMLLCLVLEGRTLSRHPAACCLPPSRFTICWAVWSPPEPWLRRHPACWVSGHDPAHGTNRYEIILRTRMFMTSAVIMSCVRCVIVRDSHWILQWTCVCTWRQGSPLSHFPWFQ